MGRRTAAVARLGAVACLAALVAGVASSASPGAPAGAAASASTPGSTVPKTAGGVHGTPGYLVYWDQNEEVDFLSMPSGTQGQLLRAWDLNGQVCVLPGGRFVGGYDPTLPNQDNLGSAKPYKQPADGEELDEPNGSFSGETLYVPGPYKMPGQSVGQDSPPTANGVFNNNSTYTGCALDKHANVFGTDIATAQGDYPPAEQRAPGRVVRAELHHLLHRTTDRPRVATDRITPMGREAWPNPGPWRWRPMGTCSCPMWAPRACCASPPRRCPPVRRSVPAGSTRGPRSTCRRSSAGCPSPPGWPGTRPAGVTPSAASSATPPSPG